MRRSYGVGLVLAVVSLLPLMGQAEEASLDCQGPSGTYQVAAIVSCSEALTAKEAAERYLDALLQQNEGRTPEELAAILEEEASATCDQRPEKGTVGDLLGIDRWGCEAGYVRRNLCEGYYLERIEPAEYGYSVVYHIVLSTGAPTLTYFDAASAVRWKAAAGDARILVSLALRSDPSSNPPAGYEETLKVSRKGQARAVLNDALGYCEEYEADYCRALRSVAARITLPPSSVAPEDREAPIELVVTAKADGHLSASHDLGLTSQDVSLISVSGSIEDEEGRPLEGVEVRFREWDVVTTSDAQGEYRLSAFGTGKTPVARRVDLELQRVELSVALEERSRGGARYLGVAADGTSSLYVNLAARGIRLDSISVRTPRLGRFLETGPRGSISFGEEGATRLVYVPPSDLGQAALTQSVDVRGDGGALIRAAVVPVAFDYVDFEGTPGSVTVEILVCRPPVVLTYAFAADRSAWTAFSEYAHGVGFDSLLVEAFTKQTATGTIEEEAQLLRKAIAEQMTAHASIGIKLSRVDVIAHGLAGLVARCAVEETTDDGGIVRRMILVATPNHGVDWLEGASGVIKPWLEQHPTVAQEVGENSDFLRRLNAAESIGTHLNPNVQYANVFGSRTALRAGGEIGLGPTEDDGFVGTASAHLEGVVEYIYDGIRHSEALPLRDIAIAGFSDVWARLVDLLQQDLPRPELDDSSMEIRTGGGPVEVCPQVWVGAWTNMSQYPISIRPGTGIRTGKAGHALIGLYTAEGQWGSVGLDEDTEIIIHSSSPRVLSIRLLAGSVRFRRLTGVPGGRACEVVMTSGTQGDAWYVLRSETRVLGRGADFVAARADETTVFSLDGQLMVETTNSGGVSSARWVQSSQGIRIRSTGVVEEEPVPGRGWWTRSVWREPSPPFKFPMWILPVTLAGALVAAAYHVRARKRWSKERSAPHGG